MAYKSPGVTVINQFEPSLNPAVGGDRLLAIAAGFDSTNLNFYPTRVLNFRRADVRYSSFDMVTYEKPEESLFDIPLDDRVIGMTQGSTTYTQVATVGHGSWDGTTYSRNGYALLKRIEFTRNTVALADPAVEWDMAGQPFVAEDATLAGGTDFVRGSAEGANPAKRWLYTYNQVSNTFTTFHEGEDFSMVVEAGAGTNVKATVTWLIDPSLPNGTKYYGLYRDINDANTAATDANEHTWYDVMTGYTAEAAKGYDYLLLTHAGTGDYVKNIGFVTYWLKDGVVRVGLVQTPPAAVDASSAYSMTIRYEVPAGANLYTTYDEVVKAFGPITDPTNASVLNEVSFAGYLAFGEGSPTVMISAWGGTTTMDNAFEALALRDDVNIVTAVANDAIQDENTGEANYKLYQHVANTSSDVAKKYRIGLYNPYTADLTSATFTTALDAYDNETQFVNSNRMLCIAPSKCSFNIPVPPLGTARRYSFQGKYLGVVYGAMMCRPEYDVATSMLRKQSKTLVDVSPKWDDIKMDKLASKAVTLFTRINAQMTVRDDITTSRLNQILQSEPTITMISDNIAKTAIQIFDNAVIGAKLKVPVMLEAIKARLLNMLDLKTRDGIITGYGTPAVTVDSLDPRKVNVTIPVQPIFTLKYLDITFSYVSRL